MHICRLLSSVHFIPPNAHRRVDLSLHIRARSARKAAQPAEARACRSDHDRPRTANVHLGTVVTGIRSPPPPPPFWVRGDHMPRQLGPPRTQLPRQVGPPGPRCLDVKN